MYLFLPYLSILHNDLFLQGTLVLFFNIDIMFTLSISRNIIFMYLRQNWYKRSKVMKHKELDLSSSCEYAAMQNEIKNYNKSEIPTRTIQNNLHWKWPLNLTAYFLLPTWTPWVFFVYAIIYCAKIYKSPWNILETRYILNVIWYQQHTQQTNFSSKFSIHATS